MKARTFDCADVNKYVRPTVVRLNKAIAFLAIEKLHNTRCHFRLQCLRNRLLPTQHVSTFDPAVSWEGKAPRARPSRQPDNSNVVTLSAFGKMDIRTISEHTSRPPGADQGSMAQRQPSRTSGSTSQQGRRPRSSAPVRGVGREGMRAHAHPSGPLGCEGARGDPWQSKALHGP
jgi:hypothetical protein